MEGDVDTLLGHGLNDYIIYLLFHVGVRKCHVCVSWGSTHHMHTLVSFGRMDAFVLKIDRQTRSRGKQKEGSGHEHGDSGHV